MQLSNIELKVVAPVVSIAGIWFSNLQLANICEKSVQVGKLRVPVTVTNFSHETKNEEHMVAIGADILPTLAKLLQCENILFALTHSVSVRSPVDVK